MNVYPSVRKLTIQNRRGKSGSVTNVSVRICLNKIAAFNLIEKIQAATRKITPVILRKVRQNFMRRVA